MIADTFHLDQKPARAAAQIKPPLSPNKGLSANVAAALVNCFDWGKTPEGYTHWNDIYHRLMDMAK